MKQNHIVLAGVPVANRILTIRGNKVMVDADIAEIYSVQTKALNQAVKRNKERFPDEFMFQLTRAEKEKVVTICDHLQRLKFSPRLPYAFTEHGIIMLASVLNSPVAVQASIQVVKAFIHFREMLSAHKDLLRRMDALENKYDAQFKGVFDAIRKLMTPPEKPKRRIGFRRTSACSALKNGV